MFSIVISFVNFLIVLFSSNSIFKLLFLIINYLVRFYQILITKKKKFTNISIMLMLLPIIYIYSTEYYILQFFAAFILKYYLDFIWHPKNTCLSYDWIISYFVSGILTLRGSLLDQIHFNFNILRVFIVSISITLILIVPIAKKINFSNIEYPNFKKIYQYYTGLQLRNYQIPIAILIHLVYELFFDKILEGIIFFVIFKNSFSLFGFTLQLILTNLCYTIFQTLSMYYEEEFRVKYFFLCSGVCAIFQYIFYYYNNLIPLSIFHTIIFMFQYMLFYKTSEVYLKTKIL